MKPADLLLYLCLLLLTLLLSHPTLSHPAASAVAGPLPPDIHTRGRFTCKAATIHGPLTASTRALAQRLRDARRNAQCTQERRWEPKCTVLAQDGDEARIAVCGYPKGWITCSWVVFAALEIAAACAVPATGRAAGEFVFDGKPGMRVVVYKVGHGP